MAVPVKLVALVCAIVGTTCGSAAGPAGAGALAVVALAFLAAQGRWRLAAGGAAVVAVLGVLLALIRFAGLRMAVFSEFHVLMFWNLSPVFLTGWALVSTPPGELSSFLSRVGAPTAVILGVLVAFRFFPTMRAAVSATAASMRNRGLAEAGSVARHPLRTCEYVAVPLLLRCVQVVDQLAVSATARGADSPGARGSYHVRKLDARGVAWMALWLVAAGAVSIGGALMDGVR